jgi:hypothetical protein
MGKVMEQYGHLEKNYYKCANCSVTFPFLKAWDNKKQKLGVRFCCKKCWYSWKSKNVSSWNKGLKKDSDSRLNYKRSNTFKKGMTPWNKGLLGFRGGSKSHFWKGGVLSLNNAIRFSKESKIWKKAILSRDNFTCVSCKKHGVKFHVDHIKKFSEITKEFLSKYSQFSPCEDRETLLRLASTHEPFWDINNGRTLCVDCHKHTETYLKK